MFAQWRLTVRKAEHALAMGQLEDACRFVTSPDVRSYRQARELRARVARALAERAAGSLREGDSQRAWQDLVEAERLNGGDGQLGAVRRELVRRGLDEARGYLENGRPDAALQCLSRLGERAGGSAELRRLQEVAAAWESARVQARAGRFAHAVEQYGLARALLPDCAALTAQHQEAEGFPQKIAALEASLHQALSGPDWDAALAHADAILALAPEHAPARAARRRAWQAVGVPASRTGGEDVAPAARRGLADGRTVLRSPDAGRQPVEHGSPLRERPPHGLRDHAADADRAGQRFLLWIDGVGGYLVCLNDRVSIGQPAGWHVDIALMADLSRLHAWIERDGEGYLLRAVRPSAVNGRIVHAAAVLADGAEIVLGQGVRLRLRQPAPLSATARVDLESRHRLSPPADGVVLMADTCIIGPRPGSHIVAAGWRSELVLYRRGHELWCRALGSFEVDGELRQERAPLSLASRLRGDGFSLALEPLDSVPQAGG